MEEGEMGGLKVGTLPAKGRGRQQGSAAATRRTGGAVLPENPRQVKPSH